MPIVLSSGDEDDEEESKVEEKREVVQKKPIIEDEGSDDSSSEELETGLVRKRIAMQDTVYAVRDWTTEDKTKLIELRNQGVTWEKLSTIFNLQPKSLQLRYDEVLSPEAFEDETWSFDDQVKLIEWCTNSFKLQGFINFPTLSKKLNKDVNDCKTKWQSFGITLGKKRKRENDLDGKEGKRSSVYKGRSNVYKPRTLSESEGDYSDGSSDSEPEGGVKQILAQSKIKITPQKKLKRKKRQRQRLIRPKGARTKKAAEQRELEELWEVADRLQPTRSRRRCSRKQGFWSEKMDEFEDAFEERDMFELSDDIDHAQYGY